MRRGDPNSPLRRRAARFACRRWIAAGVPPAVHVVFLAYDGTMLEGESLATLARASTVLCCAVALSASSSHCGIYRPTGTGHWGIVSCMCFTLLLGGAWRGNLREGALLSEGWVGVLASGSLGSVFR